MSVDLKRCPCCGEEATFDHIKDQDSPNFDGCLIRCTNEQCGLTTDLIFACGDDPQPLLAERWNKRTALAAARAEGIAEGRAGVVGEIAAERARQMASEGWSPQHDDKHVRGEMAKAAAAYADHAARFGDAESLGFKYTIAAPNPLWPWGRGWWKPKNPRRDLIKAAALIMAEIERLDRAAIRSLPPSADGGEG